MKEHLIPPFIEGAPNYLQLTLNFWTKSQALISIKAIQTSS